MEIFKLFEATVTRVQPGHPSLKDLRHDQLLDRYNEAEAALQTLIRAKEHEIAYRSDLIEMIEKCKQHHERKLIKARQAYQNAKKQAPDSLDVIRSSTPPSPPPSQLSNSRTEYNTISNITTHSDLPASQPGTIPQSVNSFSVESSGSSSQSPHKFSELDIPIPSDNYENRSSLDRRLSEFLKTFPNLAQSGLAAPGAENSSVKPMPGYYTQQQPIPQMTGPTPPVMAMLRFPPPNLVPQPAPNPLPFDPSIMEPRLRDSSSSNGNRGDNKHSQNDRSRHSGSSSGSGSGMKHGSDKNKRNKRR